MSVLADADVLVLGSDGMHPTPGVLVQALASGIVPVASSIPVYAELLSDGARGLQYQPGDAQTLAANLAQLASDPGCWRSCGTRPSRCASG